MSSTLGLFMGFVCSLIPLSGNDQEAIAIQTLCLSSFEVWLNFNTSQGGCGARQDLIWTLSQIQLSPMVLFKMKALMPTVEHKKESKLTGRFYLHRQNGSPSSCAFFEITGTLKNEQTNLPWLLRNIEQKRVSKENVFVSCESAVNGL